MYRPLLEVEQFDGRCVFAVGGSRLGQRLLFINILDSLTVLCLVYNTAMYTVYGRCGQHGRCMVHTLAGAIQCGSEFYVICNELGTEQR